MNVLDRSESHNVITRESIEAELQKHGVRYKQEHLDVREAGGWFYDMHAYGTIYYFTSEWKLLHFPQWVDKDFDDLWDRLRLSCLLEYVTISDDGEILHEAYNGKQYTFTTQTLNNGFVYKKFYNYSTVVWYTFEKDGARKQPTILGIQVSDITIQNGDILYNWIQIPFDENLSYHPKTLSVEGQTYIEHDHNIYLYDEEYIFWEAVKNKKQLRILKQKMRQMEVVVNNTQQAVKETI